ncbi:Hypothetical predicted protein [Cloeon dipterum]|uniref:Uncharacterized protein n=1 Tax=Cloeon dipterum TaxID=197152 RepID=A0A8S1DDH3_9INSE|nr:Hypothetical predicted protein [Cloeon dipterum]
MRIFNSCFGKYAKLQKIPLKKQFFAMQLFFTGFCDPYLEHSLEVRIIFPGGMPAEDEPSAGVRQARAPTFFGPSIRVYSGGYGHGYPVYRPYGYYGGGSRIIITKRLGGYGYGGYGGHYYY